MTLVIQILISLVLLGAVPIIWWVVFFLWFNKTQDIVNLIPKVNLKKKQDAVIFTDEIPTEEEIAIEREERILKTIGAEK